MSERKKRINEKIYTTATYLMVGLSIAPAILAYVAVVLGLWRLIVWMMASA